jgi:DNA-binding transcriptional MocR family regulator
VAPLNFLAHLSLDHSSDIPLYRQLAESIRFAVNSGTLGHGDRLPATRELAGRLGLNRTTVSAAYSVLERAGLLQGQVGRGSFVAVAESRRDPQTAAGPTPFDWHAVLAQEEPATVPSANVSINFASSRPAEDRFPITEFRALSKQVIDGPQAAEILQLGSPYGYPPLRKYLLAQSAAEGVAGAGDDLMVTNGCQQALDLLARVLVTDNVPVLLEDPVYHGLLRVFTRAGATLIPLPFGNSGFNPSVLEALVTQHRPRLLVLTPEFQNPTGVTLNIEQRRAIVGISQRFGVIVIESEIYRDLRYRGQPLPSLKQLDESGNVISIGSYSKIAFPGLRVGWVIAPEPVIARLAQAKETSDLHSDQLSQAVLLRFAESGELARHVKRTREAGAGRLQAALESCEAHLPPGSRFTRPEGGMNLWVELPAPLAAHDVLKAAEERGVSFSPGNCFSVRRTERRSLRISFGGLTPQAISRGIAILGDVAKEQLASRRGRTPPEPVAALV